MTQQYVWRDLLCVSLSLSRVEDRRLCIVWHVLFIGVTRRSHTWRRIHMYDTTRLYVWYDTFCCCDSHSCKTKDSYYRTSDSSCIVWHESFICVTWLNETCDVTHSYMWYDTFCGSYSHRYKTKDSSCIVWQNWFICVTWLNETCDVTRSRAPTRTSVRQQTPPAMCDMTHSYMWHASFLRVLWLSSWWISSWFLPSCLQENGLLLHCVTWLIHVCDMNHSYVWHDSFCGSLSLSCVQDKRL